MSAARSRASSRGIPLGATAKLLEINEREKRREISQRIGQQFTVSAGGVSTQSGSDGGAEHAVSTRSGSDGVKLASKNKKAVPIMGTAKERELGGKYQSAAADEFATVRFRCTDATRRTTGIGRVTGHIVWDGCSSAPTSLPAETI